MSTLFGGIDKSRDIAQIVEKLRGGTNALVNENVAGQEIRPMDVTNMAEEIKEIMLEHYSSYVPEKMEHMLREDAESAAQIFQNSLNEMQTTLSESAAMPGLVTLTASIATTMRTPYEAVLHRLYDTRTLEKQTVEIEEVIPTLRAPQPRTRPAPRAGPAWEKRAWRRP